MFVAVTFLSKDRGGSPVWAIGFTLTMKRSLSLPTLSIVTLPSPDDRDVF